MTRIRKCLTLILAPLWRWKWLLLVCLLATSLYACTAPREKKVQSAPPSVSLVYRFWLSQGWPRQYVHRTSQNDDLSPWTPQTHIQSFELAPLLSNLALSVLLSLLVVYAWDWHCRQNGKPWRFNLKELLLITLLVACGVGVTVYGRNQFRAGEDYLNSLAATGWQPFETTSIPPWYLQPQYDCGLLGREKWSHHTGVLWPQVRSAPDINGTVIPMAARGEQLPPYVEEIRVMNSYLTDEGADAICAWAPNCRRIYLFGTSSLSSEGLTQFAKEMPRLELFLLFGDATFSDESVKAISGMKNLRTLTMLDSQHQTSEKSLDHLKSLPNLQTVRLPAHWQISQQAKEDFANRGVEIVSLGP